MNDTDTNTPTPQAFVATARLNTGRPIQVLRLTETGLDYPFLTRIVATSTGQRALTQGAEFAAPSFGGRPSDINPFNIAADGWTEVEVPA